jgi:hypothetical protein
MPHDLLIDAQSDAVSVLSQSSFKDPKGLVFRFRGAEKPQRTDAGSGLRFVRRFGNEPGLFAFAHEDMRFLPDSGDPSTALVPLNARTAAGKSLGGVPGEVLYLPGVKKAAMTVRTPFGQPTSKVAIVDLAGNRVEHVVTTGRGSVKFGKFMGAMALSIALSSLSYYGGYSMAQATGSPFFFYNIYTFTPAPPNLELSASADGKFVYALNSQTNDVTVINTQDGTADTKIAVGGGCRRVAIAPGGRFIYSYTGGQVSLIDTQTNKKHLEHQVPSGRVLTVHTFDADKRLAALTSKSLLILDTEKGALAHAIDGFGDPYFLVQPRTSESTVQ